METRTTTSDPGVDAHARHDADQLVAVILWSASEPQRVGELIVLGPGIFGRGPATSADSAKRRLPVRRRPRGDEDAGPLEDPALSREQLRFTPDGAQVILDVAGRAGLRVDGQEVSRARVGPGAFIEVRGRLLLRVQRRQRVLPAMQPLWSRYRFGRPDPFGIVGEGDEAWRLRQRLDFAGPLSAHVLVFGPSGSGKEAVARALHQLSERRTRPMLARNAATIPESLIDAELFGHSRNYPNPGTPERLGLFGEADGGVLFLDEIAEIPHAMQAHLLRVLDAGEYHRLGDARSRRVDVRVIGATNRDPDEIKQDLAARLVVRVPVPELDARGEDVPLIAAELLRRIASQDPRIAARLFPNGDLDGYPRIGAEVVRRLVARPYTTHVRELEALLWNALQANPEGPLLTLPGADAPQKEARSPESIGRDEIVAALERNQGRQEDTWRELGLSSRYVLRRLLARHEIKGT